MPEAQCGKVVRLRPEELADAPFLFYPKRSNMRLSIDAFFHEIGITPRVIMEADDTEAIKRLVESGFGYSILPEFSLRGQRPFPRTLPRGGASPGPQAGAGDAAFGVPPGADAGNRPHDSRGVGEEIDRRRALILSRHV